jgi:gamma-glutamyl-gamma-aminobutyraldehyde dehydrogenase/4-guanidinobutyraldehyde dehydrogenase/NAD-dependent aldehyde dehydrogenase
MGSLCDLVLQKHRSGEFKRKVLLVRTFSAIKAAVVQANSTPYGLRAAVSTRNMTKVIQTARVLRAGTVQVNQYDSDDMTVLFGGYKQSGSGRDKSLHAIEKYTELKTTWIQVG